MVRIGGVNFCPKIAGGYHSNGDFDADAQLNQAMMDRLVFFVNHISGLIFGLGRWEQARCWDEVVPIQYIKIRPQDPHN